MKSVKAILTEFSGMGSRHYFRLKSREECEGWIVDVEDEHIRFVDCDPRAEKKEIKLRLGAVDIDTLEYRDDDQKCWIGARWDETKEQWLFIVTQRDEPLTERLKTTA